MTPLEERLRHELPELADALIGTSPSAELVAGDRQGMKAVGSTPNGRGSRWMPVVTIAAAVVLVVGGFVGFGLLRGHVPDENSAGSTDSLAPTSFGEWSSLADAPIETRPYAVSAWTGSEAVFWAGSSLSRGFAFTDGAAYNPATGTWRTMTVPGWGHPGLTAAFFDGDLYALAKGGGTRIDPTSGTQRDLPPVQGMYLAATVASDDAVWGIGPVSVDTSGQPDLAIARYDPTNDSWIYGSTFEGTDEQASIVSGLSQLESDVVWTGSEIVIWNGNDGGIAYDPQQDTWRSVAAPISPIGPIIDSTITMTDAGLVVVAQVANGNETSVNIATLNDDRWDWADTNIPIQRFGTITVAAAGDWIMIFSADERPATVHVPSGAWQRDKSSPLAGLQGPNTVWTGESLIIWGGQSTPVPGATGPADGAVWTPPAN